MFREKVPITHQNIMLYQGQDLKLAQGKEVWTDRWHGPELVKYIRYAACCGHVFKRLPDEGEDSVIQCRKSPDGREFVCADTREELLLHLISQQQQRIAEANLEIDRLNGLREVAA